MPQLFHPLTNFTIMQPLAIRYLMLLTLLQQLIIISCTTTILETTYPLETTTLERRTEESQDFESDPLGLNFEPSEPRQHQTEFSNVSEEWLLDLPNFQWIKKPTELRREVEPVPRMMPTFYESNFNQRYVQHFNYSSIFENLGKNIPVKSSRNFQSTDYSFSSFPSLNEIYEYLTLLEKLSEGRAVIIPLQQHNGSWNNIHTNYGNEILSIRISSKSAIDHKRNPIIVVVAGIHGRDWYAVQSAIFASTELIVNVNRTKRHDVDWWIIPVLNPDGYEISHTGSEWRDWEKNLHGMGESRNGKCFGVDLDLNFEYQLLSCNYSSCDFNFSGEIPFIAPEARGLRDTLGAFDDDCDSFIALKERRQLLVYPFSDTLESPRNIESIYKISKAAVEAFQKHVEGSFEFGQSSHMIDIQAGFIEDWAKVHLGVEKSFAFYLGPTDKDRRELTSQHLMDHMNGTFELLQIIASRKIETKTSRSSFCRINLFLIYIVLNLLKIA